MDFASVANSDDRVAFNVAFDNYGRRLADRALEKAIDPDEARRARGEADFQTRRALELAFDNNEVQKLRAEVVKLLQLPK
jgi:hypothetical protein